MSNNTKKNRRKTRKWEWALFFAAFFLSLSMLAYGVILLIQENADREAERLAQMHAGTEPTIQAHEVHETAPQQQATVPTETTLPPETTLPTESTAPAETTPPQILSSMEELCRKNPDIAGWIKIDGTRIDYPVMHTPDDPEKYLHLNFDARYSFAGLPFIDSNCSMDPESDNLLIYGHNMENGTMFRDLMYYDMITFWQNHKTIHFSTLYEEREYEVVAAFYDRVYFPEEDCFKFYQFIDAADQKEFDTAIAYFKEKALYDTGVSAQYGDSLLSLVTCAYHVADGRFVVVAREVKQ